MDELKYRCGRGRYQFAFIVDVIWYIWAYAAAQALGKRKQGGWTGHRHAFPSMLEARRMMIGHTNLSTIILSGGGVLENKE